MIDEQAEASISEGLEIISEMMVALREAKWLIEYARCQGEYGLSDEWLKRYEVWKKEVGV